MNFSFINKFFIIISFIFIISCQDKIKLFDDNNNSININDKNNNIENTEKIDFSIIKIQNEYSLDFYSNHSVNYDFLQNKLKNIKINNYQKNNKNNPPINIFYKNNFIYSINYKGEILKFDIETSKLEEKIILDDKFKNKRPISFSLFNNEFIIGFKSGEIIKINDMGDVIWEYNKHKLLNTPIRHYENNIIVLFPEDIVFLSIDNGEEIFKKNYKSSNIIQSTGGKIIDYFNLIFVLLPNSKFHIIDTFFFEEYIVIS